MGYLAAGPCSNSVGQRQRLAMHCATLRVDGMEVPCQLGEAERDSGMKVGVGLTKLAGSSIVGDSNLVKGRSTDTFPVD